MSSRELKTPSLLLRKSGGLPSDLHADPVRVASCSDVPLAHTAKNNMTRVLLELSDTMPT